jgi:hypothetical protein
VPARRSVSCLVTLDGRILLIQSCAAQPDPNDESAAIRACEGLVRRGCLCAAPADVVYLIGMLDRSILAVLLQPIKPRWSSSLRPGACSRCSAALPPDSYCCASLGLA